MDCKELASIISKYTCSRVPHTFAPYQLSQVVVEIMGYNGDNFLNIITGDINVAYEIGKKGFRINNSHALLDEILYIMPELTDEERGLKKKNVTIFSDGEGVSLWKSVYSDRYNIYKLSDETTLLTIQATSRPNNVYVVGQESFDELNVTAQQAVSAYYEEQGLLYNTQDELEKAYVEYLNCKASETEYDEERFISQEIAPTASNDKMMYFLTSVILPVNNERSQEIQLGAAFDRVTGKALNAWDLFAVPEEEARQSLLDMCAVYNPSSRDEMEVALKPEYIILFPGHLTVTFPEGTLPSQEYRYII